MRRYGLDATPVLGRRTGIGRLVLELAGGLSKLICEDEEIVLAARTFRLNPLTGTSHEPLRRLAQAPRVRARRQWLPRQAIERAGRLLPWIEVDCLAGRLDVYHGTNYSLPATRARAVVSIHDLAVLRFPEHVDAAFEAWFRHAVATSVPRARRVLTLSHSAADDVAELLDVPRDRITTIEPGVGPEFRESDDPERDRADLEVLYGVGAPFVLFVGTTHPRKNLDRLLDAFAAARRAAALPHRLVLVGDRGFGDAAVRARVAALGLDGVVQLPGYVADEDLPLFYRAADALAFPTLYEGFGLPLVEAMASGCPVLTSNRSCLPEIAGDAALLVDPTSADEIAAGLARITGDAALRASLVAKGRARAARFTWRSFAERHLAVYRELAASDS